MLIHEQLLLIEKDKPKTDWPISEATREKLVALVFCFLANETRKLRKKINHLEETQLSFEEERPALLVDNHRANPKADCHVD